MGLLNAIKGANNSWGTAVIKDAIGSFGPKNLVNNTSHELSIIVSGKSTVFAATEVEKIKLVASTSDWGKYSIKLVNGFEAIVTVMAKTVGNKGVKMSMELANFEWWLFNKLYK